MSQYSEMMGSFIRRGNFPIEADYIFYSEAELKEFYSQPENNAILHRGLLKIVVDQESGLQSLYWVNKKETNDELEFTKLLDAESIEDLTEAIEDLEKRLQQEIKDRIAGDNAIWGTENPTIIPEDLNCILDLANAVTEIREKLKEHDEALANLLEICKAIAGCEEDDVISYLQTLDYQNLTQVSQTLHKFLQEYDYTDSTINTFPELQKFLEGFTDQDNLLDILTKLWYNIQGDPLPTESFRTLRGIEDYVRDFEADIKHQADNIQKELDNTQVGVGLSADGSYSPDQETYYLDDTTSVMNALKVLDYYINEAIKYCRIRPTDTNTVDLTVNHYDEYNEIIADVKISKESGNGIIVKEDGLYHKVITEYSADGVLTLKVNEEIVAQHNLGLSYIGISSAYYDPTTEDLVIVFEKENTSTEELRIPVYTLIREWVVNNTHPNDVVVLTRKEVLGGAPDELSADVRLFEDKYNILVKEGNTLYVKGTSSNIIHDGDVTVEYKINELDDRTSSLEERATSLEDNLAQEISDRTNADKALQDQITANDNDIASLQSELDATQVGAGLGLNGDYVVNEQSSYLKEATSLHDATQKLDNALQAESDRAIARENEIEDALEAESVRAKGVEQDLQAQINSNDTDISNLQSELNKTQASVGLSDDGDYLPNAQATYINEATSIYQSTQLLDIALKTEASRSENKDNQLSDALQNEIDRATAAESVLDEAIKAENARAIGKENELQSELDNTQSAIGLNEDGTYKASEAASYINDATSVYDATVKLDAKLKETSDSLEGEISRAEAKENELAQSIAAEQERAEAAEQALSENIENVESTLIEAITDETNRAIEKENALQAELDSTQSGSGLQADGSYKANEQAAYIKDATSLYDATQKLDIALREEESRSKAKDIELENTLTAEINRSTTKDEALQAELDATQEGIGLSDDGKYLPNAQAKYINEASSIYDSTQKLDIALANESSRAEQSEKDLTDAINAEKARAEAAEQVLTDNLNAEIATRISEDNRVAKEASDALNSVKTELEGLLNAEQTRAESAEKTITDNLNQEVLDRIADVDAEQARAEEAERVLTDNLNAEISRAQGIENALQSELNNTQVGAGLEADGSYKANPQSEYLKDAISLHDAEQKLDIAIKEEVARAKDSEAVLQTNITNEFNRATAAEQALSDSLQAEITRAKDSEQNLQQSVNNLQSELDATQLGSGLNLDGTYAPNAQSSYLKEATSLYDATQKLDVALNEEVNRAKIVESDLQNQITELNKNTTVAVIDTNTVDLTKSIEETGYSIKADVKIDSDNATNIILTNSKGLTASVDLTYDVVTNKLLFTTTGNQSKEIQLSNHSLVDSINYDPASESIVFVYSVDGIQQEPVFVPVHNLIQEWTVVNDSQSPIKLAKKIVEANGQDELSAEVILSNDVDNILFNQNGALKVSGAKIELNTRTIAELQNSLNIVETNLNEEINRAKDSESKLSEDLQTEVDRAKWAEQEISTNLSSEINTSRNTEQNLQNQISEVSNKLTEEITRSVNRDDALNTAITTEKERALASEQALDSKITEEYNRAKLAEQQIANDLTSEITTARQEEKILLDKINTVESNLNIEINRSTLKDEELNKNLLDEKDRALTIEGQLNSAISEESNRAKLAEQQLAEDLSDEITRSSDKDLDLQNQITKISQDLSQDISDVQSALESEITRSTEKDATLQQQISDELNRAKLAEQELANSVSREELRATNAESILNQSIENVNTLLQNEIDRSNREDDRLKTQIESEVARATTSENNLNSSIIEESNRAQLAEETLRTQIADNTAADILLKERVIANEESLNNEITRSTEKDIELNNSILEEKARASAEEVKLQESINSEYNRALRAEQQLTEDLNDEIARASHAEEVLLSKVNQEITDRTNADENLQTQIDALQNAQNGALGEAVANLTEMIQAETDRATSAEQNLQEQINANVAKDSEQDVELAKKVENVELVKEADLQYTLYVDGEAAGTIVIPEDQFLKSVDYDPLTQVLTFVFDTGAGESTTKINVSDLVDIYTAGHGLSLSANNVFEVVIDSTSESFLTVSANGVKLSGVQAAIDSAVSAEQNRATAVEADLQRQITENTNSIISTSETLSDEILRSTTKDSELNDAITAEKTRAELAEATLQNNINNEKVRAEAAELQLTTNVNNEIARAKESEQAITSRINNIETVTLVELTNTVNSEIQRSKDKDSALEKLIQDETNRATAAETQLSNDLAAETARAEAADQILENNITIEKNRAEAAEQNLSDRIDTLTTNSNSEIANLKTSLNNEISRSTEKDNELTDLLTQEVNRATVAEQNVLNIVNNEITRSSEKDVFLETAINNEVTRAKESEQDLWVMVTGETNRATLAEKDLQDQIKALEVGSEGSLADLVAKNNEQDQELAKKIESVSVNKINDLQYDVLVDGASVGTINIPEDQFLKSVVYDDSTKVLTFTFNTLEEDDKVITIKISDLIDTYLAGDGLRLAEHTFHISLDPNTESFLTVGPNGLKLQGVQTSINTAVQTEVDRATEAERQLQQQITTNATNISNVSSRLEEKITEFSNKDLDLQNQITAEVSRAKLVEQDLQNQITNEVNRATSVEQTMSTNVTNLTSRVDTEIQRSTQVDTDLQRQIDNEVQRATNTETQNKTDLQNQITNEVNRAKDKESALETLITNEVNRATASESTLEGRITSLEEKTTTTAGAVKEELQAQIDIITAKNLEQDEQLANKLESVELVKVSDLLYTIKVDGVDAGSITIPKDKFLKNVSYDKSSQDMKFVFITSADEEQTTTINLTDLVNVYSAGNGLSLENNKFSIALDPTCEQYLSVTASGIKLSGVSDAITTAVSVEQNRATTVENQLNEKLSTLEGKVNENISDIKDLTTDLNNESTARQSKDTELSNLISNLDTKVDSTKESLETKLTSTKESLETQISAEKERAQGVENSLLTQINTNTQSISSEITRAKEAEQSLQDQISSINTSIGGNVVNELTAIKENITNIEGDVTDLTTKVDTLEGGLDSHVKDYNNPHKVTKAQLGLDKVENISPRDLPVSDAVQTALNTTNTTLQTVQASLNTHLTDQNNPHKVTKDQVGLGNVDNTSDVNKPISLAQQTEFNRIDGVLNNKANQVDLTSHLNNQANPHNVTKAQIGLDKVENIAPRELPISDAVQVELNAINEALKSQQSGNSGHLTDYNNPHKVTKAQIGLDRVDNTSDMEKPVSTLQQIEIDKVSSAVALKANQSDLSTHVNNTNNPHSVTAAQVGLGKVDNTSDMEKPISTATQAALSNINTTIAGLVTKDQLDAHKSDKNNPHNVTASQVGLGNVNNTSDMDKPISTATQIALDKKADVHHDHTMADISDLENFPVIKGFVTSVSELPENPAGGDKYMRVNNGKYVLYEYDGGNSSWDEKIITSGMVTSVIGGDVYKLNPAGSTYVRPERILDESYYKETYDRIWNETKDLIQSIEWEENDATGDSNGQIRLKITTKKAYAAPVASENGEAVQPDVQPQVTYIDIDKTRFLKSAYSRPATQADVTNGYATAVGIPVLVMELTTGDEVVIDLSQTMNIYAPTDTNSIDMTVSDWTGTAGTSYKISAAVKRNTTEDVKDAVELVETTNGLTANLTVKDTSSINLTNDTKANGGLRADLVIDNTINNVSGVKLTVGSAGLSATMVWGEYD